MVESKRVKVRVKNDRSKEELIEEAMCDNKEYFSALAREFGEDEAEKARKEYKLQLEEDLKDYVQGEEFEVEMVKVD